MKRFALAIVVTIGMCAVAATAPPAESEPKTVKPDPLVTKLEAVTAENADLKAKLTQLAAQANGLLAKVGELSQVNVLLELEVKRLAADLEAARKGK